MAHSQNSPRTSFNGSLNSSQLVRLLASLDVAAAAGSERTFAERLSQWVEWTDAISLSDALKKSDSQVSDASQAKPDGRCSPQALIEQVRRLRLDLTELISRDTVLTRASEQADLRTWRRQYSGHQQAMETRIGPLRARARAALSAASPALGRLAALDGVFDEALLARERQLLSTTAGLLEKHFARLRKASQGMLQQGSHEISHEISHEMSREMSQDRPHPTTERQLKTTTISEIIQSALLAELELRLQPIEGMIEALDNEAGNRTSGQP